MVEARLRGRDQWGLGRPADRSTQRSEQHARLDHRGRAVGVHHSRRDGEVFPVLGGGTIGVNSSMCRPSKAKVVLSSSGLRGGVVPQSVSAIECASPRRLLVRFRASVKGSSALRERARIFLATNAPAREATLAVRTLTGRLLAYADVSESGKARQFTAKGCTPE